MRARSNEHRIYFFAYRNYRAGPTRYVWGGGGRVSCFHPRLTHCSETISGTPQDRRQHTGPEQDSSEILELTPTGTHGTTGTRAHRNSRNYWNSRPQELTELTPTGTLELLELTPTGTLELLELAPIGTLELTELLELTEHRNFYATIGTPTNFVTHHEFCTFHRNRSHRNLGNSHNASGSSLRLDVSQYRTRSSSKHSRLR